jgi:hypothetical protein
LPSHALQSTSKAQCLQKAYDLLVKIHKLKVQPTDEVCKKKWNILKKKKKKKKKKCL